MIPNLPRELLWRDKTDMTEFMSEELSNTVISIFNFAKSRITISLGSEMMLNLYNEAFYLCTRFVYEHDAAANPKSYREMIIDDLGKKELAEHVILIMFMILMLQPDKSKDVLLFADKLQKQYLQDTPFKILNWIHKVFKPRNNNASFTLKPCPYPADMLKNIYIDWCQITLGFSKHVIIDILDLWDDDIEKGKVIRLIEQAYTLYKADLKEDDQADIADEDFFVQQKDLYNISNDAFPVITIIDESECVLSVEKCFRFNNDFVKNSVEMLIQEFYLGETVNLALIEIVLFDHKLLVKRNNHKHLVKILKGWGALPMNLDEKKIANGMSQKMAQLPKSRYKEWDNSYINDRQKCIKIGEKLPPSIRYGR